MFESSFVDTGKTRRPLTVAIACVGEAMLIGGLVLAPLLFVQPLPDRALLGALMLAPVPSAPPPPPPPMIAKPVPRAVRVVRKFNPAALVSPVVVPKAVAVIDEAPPVDLNAMAQGVPGGIPGAVVGGAGTGFFGNGIAAAPLPPPPPPKIVAAAPATPRQITVGGAVEAAMILHHVQPVYPLMARQAHISGSVKLKAVIGTDGRIKDLTLLSGHPLLVGAAMDAVRNWVYKPTMLDGVLVEVKTDIEVRFGLTIETGSNWEPAKRGEDGAIGA